MNAARSTKNRERLHPVTAPVAADETSLAYFAITPV
jgi:hypothetical protein